MARRDERHASGSLPYTANLGRQILSGTGPYRSWSRSTIAASSVPAEPVRNSCRPVTGSYPPEIRTWCVLPRCRMPVRSFGPLQCER